LSFNAYDPKSTFESEERFEMTFKTILKYLEFDEKLNSMLEGGSISGTGILPDNILIDEGKRNETFTLTGNDLTISFNEKKKISIKKEYSEINEIKRFEESSNPTVQKIIENEIRIIQKSLNNPNDVVFTRYDPSSDTTVIYISSSKIKEEEKFNKSPIDYRKLSGYEKYIKNHELYTKEKFKEIYDSGTLYGLIESTKLILLDVDAPQELKLQAYVVANWLLYKNDFNEQISIRLSTNDSTDSFSKFSTLDERFSPGFSNMSAPNSASFTFKPMLSLNQIQSIFFKDMEGIEIVKTIEDLQKNEIEHLTIDQIEDLSNILEGDDSISGEVKIKIYNKIYN
jgi:hypothetical protein